MPTFIALLRDINVGGQKKIKMAELKAQLAPLGFQYLQTYIQSGNIVFQFPETPPRELAEQIEQEILAGYGFEVPTLVKRLADMQEVIQKNPFVGARARDTTRLYVTFLHAQPEAARLEALQAEDYLPEEFIVQGQNLYFFSPIGYGRAKMNNNFFEKKLKLHATTRNWRTIHKLLEMATAR